MSAGVPISVGPLPHPTGPPVDDRQRPQSTTSFCRVVAKHSITNQSAARIGRTTRQRKCEKKLTIYLTPKVTLFAAYARNC